MKAPHYRTRPFGTAPGERLGYIASSENFSFLFGTFDKHKMCPNTEHKCRNKYVPYPVRQNARFLTYFLLLGLIEPSELCRYVAHNSLRNNTTILLVGSKVIKRIMITTKISSSSSSIYYIYREQTRISPGFTRMYLPGSVVA